MSGRPITNHSQRAQDKREQMRRLRAEKKVRPARFNPQPLAQVFAAWRKA